MTALCVLVMCHSCFAVSSTHSMTSERKSGGQGSPTHRGQGPRQIFSAAVKDRQHLEAKGLGGSFLWRSRIANMHISIISVRRLMIASIRVSLILYFLRRCRFVLKHSLIYVSVLMISAEACLPTPPTRQSGVGSSFEAMHASTAMDACMSTMPGRRGQSLLLLMWCGTLT